MSRIKLHDASPNPVVSVPMPLDQALEWVSAHEYRVDARVKIFFDQSAYSGCVEHTRSEPEHEVGGLLIGDVRVDPLHARPYIVIQNILPALDTEASETHVTFTQKTLLKLHGELEDRYPGKRILGWYHTHPHLGIFLSSYDTWIHEHFFSDPTQVALVVDPYFERGGFFVWQTNRRLDPTHYVGFYELGNIGDDSLVEWDNLEPVLDGEELEAESGTPPAERDT